jgi:Lipase (class 3)
MMLTTNQTYAVMALCARDADVIFTEFSGTNPAGNPTLPVAGDPNYAYVTQQYWTALGQIRCDDLVITKGLNCYYGLLLQCTNAFGPFQIGDFLVAVRGTMDALEWANDAMSEIPVHLPGRSGSVAMGFWNVYASMTFADLSGANVQAKPAAVIAAKTGAFSQRLFVTGHSLGAAMATYLTADLQPLLAAGAPFQPFFFALPRVGTSDYVDDYQATVAAYDVVNYAADLVPNLPTDPPFSSINSGGATHNVHLIPKGLPGAPPSSLTNNHSCVAYARLLDPANAEAQRLPIP